MQDEMSCEVERPVAGGKQAKAERHHDMQLEVIQ